ncbi:S8 family serine peptidase [Flavobacterium humi]|uniref:Peptidase S8 n=1 Tax=Flavobacterium humi TaxID=2562683 RepID=A0A4Z0LAL7_9FLAO|nr:S8 family serine peptidase [Flavobacterium humi]TGD58732.1 peptidase S8 [Flavobacterium humi]
MKLNIFFLIPFLFFGISSESQITEENELNNAISKKWYKKDFLDDKVLGISLDKFYKNQKAAKNQKKVTVAVIDSQIDLNQEDLKEGFWVNKKEIPNNNKDDDHNDYIDDVNGWSFIGTKSGGYMVYENFEYVRCIREWDAKFKNKLKSDISNNEMSDYEEYQRAIKFNEIKNKYYKNWQKSLLFDIELFPIVKDTLKHFFPKEDYTIKQLDSLYKTYKINDKTFRQRRDSNDRDLGALIDYMIGNLELNHKTIDDIKEQSIQLDSVINRNLNISFEERKLIGDNPNILEKGYGNNKVGVTITGVTSTKEHATKVSGIIASRRNNQKGIEGFSDNISIMPLHVSASGDEHDKDITMAIRYAVDNGAKVINMSIGKEFSLHKDWVDDAYKYAEQHNVLLVHASGNDGMDVDVNPYYPSDYNYDNTGEICNNFINVGSISNRNGDLIVSQFSNYGKKNVDLFAPGEDIYTTAPNNTYEFDSGTSLAAPMVSGTAALIWSYYPKLTVQQVKQIILESGTPYDIDVFIPKGKGMKLPFKELSKTGKILNVYNAMQMAKMMSKG